MWFERRDRFGATLSGPRLVKTDLAGVRVDSAAWTGIDTVVLWRRADGSLWLSGVTVDGALSRPDVMVEPSGVIVSTIASGPNSLGLAYSSRLFGFNCST